MKRKLTLTFLVSTILCMAIILSSCNSPNISHPIDEIKTKMENDGNYRVSIKMNLDYYSLYDNVSYGEKVIEYDGNLKHIKTYTRKGKKSISTEEYVNTLTGEACKKEWDNGPWKASTHTEQNSVSIGMDFTNGISFPQSLLNALFDPNNYTQVQGTDNTYIQKLGVVFDTIENVKFEINDTGCIITMDISGKTGTITITVSDIGNIELEMPKY